MGSVVGCPLGSIVGCSKNPPLVGGDVSGSAVGGLVALQSAQPSQLESVRHWGETQAPQSLVGGGVTTTVGSDVGGIVTHPGHPEHNGFDVHPGVGH